MNIKAFALAGIAAVGMSGMASAATLNINGGTTVDFESGNYKSDCSGGKATCYDPTGPAGAFDFDLQAFFSSATYPGLTLSAPAPVRVTFLGKEAGATNAVFTMGTQQLTNVMAIGSSFVYSAVPGLNDALDFTFRVINAAGGASLGSEAGSDGFTPGAGIAFYQVNSRLVYAYFDDSGAGENGDWDDMVVSIEVIPLPASALLLLGGLGGLAAMKRRRKAA